MRRSHRLQGLPPNFPPSMEERERETMDQPAMTDSHVEGIDLVTKSGKEISSFESPSTVVVVQQPSVEDTTFCFLTEGQPSARDWVFTHP